MALNRENNPENSIVLGTTLTTLAFASLAIMNALAKEAANNTPVVVIVLFQNLLCLLAVAPIILLQGWKKIKTARISLHLLRAAAGTGAWIGLFLAITIIPLTNAVLLTYSAPIWMPLIAWFLHGHKAGNAVWAGVAIGFVGIALVLHPAIIKLSWGEPLALVAAILLALALLTVHWLNKTEPQIRILFYYYLFSTLFILPAALLSWQTPKPSSWIYLGGVGACLLFAQVFIIIGYKYASAVTLAPIIYTIILFTALINWIVWHQIPSAMEALGMVLIVLGGIIAMRSGDVAKENEKID